MNRWKVRKPKGCNGWHVFDDRERWEGIFPTLIEAHETATRLAINSELWKPHGLLCYFGMRRLAERTAMEGWLA